MFFASSTSQKAADTTRDRHHTHTLALAHTPSHPIQDLFWSVAVLGVCASNGEGVHSRDCDLHASAAVQLRCSTQAGHRNMGHPALHVPLNRPRPSSSFVTLSLASNPDI